jgi:hypothetical protein
MTAALDICILNGISANVPKLPHQIVRNEAIPKAPVPNRSKWYCIPEKVRLIIIPIRFTIANMALYWMNGDVLIVFKRFALRIVDVLAVV